MFPVYNFLFLDHGKFIPSSCFLKFFILCEFQFEFELSVGRKPQHIGTPETFLSKYWSPFKFLYSFNFVITGFPVRKLYHPLLSNVNSSRHAVCYYYYYFWLHVLNMLHIF